MIEFIARILDFFGKTPKTLIKIDNWELYFPKKFMGNNGGENRHLVMKDFMEFLTNKNKSKLRIEGECYIGGKISGHDSFKDGDEVLTSKLLTIERAARDNLVGVTVKDGPREFKVTGDLLCATAQSGTKYYFFAYTCNSLMAQMMGDMLFLEELNRTPGWYLSEAYKRHKKQLL